MGEPRAYTQAEVQQMFMDHLEGVVEYWLKLEPRLLPKGEDPVRYRVEGVVFSILAALDGVSAELPAYSVFPCPHPDDKEFLISEGSNYYETFPEDVELPPDIHGPHMLHDLYSARNRRRDKAQKSAEGA